MRLTIEQIKDYGKDKEYLTNAELALIKELLEYKEIEARLGVDLITLSKAFDNGIWVGGKDEYGLTLESEFWKAKTFEIKYHKCMGLCFSKITGGHTYNKTEDNFGFTLNYSAVALKDCGKTWALTKEELE